MTTQEIRSAYLKFFADQGHSIIPRANLVPREDASTLFTGSGMQPMIPYLLGAKHSSGVRLVDSQVCFRAEDIDEVGDNRHTTAFEMIGNWSLGDYFKQDQIHWIFEFLTKVVGLDPRKLYITCFIGSPEYKIPKDHEAAKIWQDLFKEQSIAADIADIGSEHDGYQRGIKEGERIFYYDGSKNWWSRNGGPETTPIGDPCGPDSEMFYDFGTEHDSKWGKHCHPNCDCGRFMEIGNNVFMAFKKVADGVFEPLQNPNIDHGSGLERIAAAKEGSGDVFRISLLWPIVLKIQELSGLKYENSPVPMRIIADHLRATVWLAVDGVVPGNSAQSYVMRRFIRRALRQAHAIGLHENFVHQIVPVIADVYRDAFPEISEREKLILEVLVREEKQFRTTLSRGVKELEKLAASEISGRDIFTLFDTYGFPFELSLEEIKDKKLKLHPDWRLEFDEHMALQKERSRTATSGQFKGGLADHSEISTKYHTATHLMYRALRTVLGDHVIQRGSNITPERLRFDFTHPEKVTSEQLLKVQNIVNEQIQHDWPMNWREEATSDVLGKVLGAFGDRYGERVKVYTVGDPDGVHFSREICGGPHVDHTGALSEGNKKFVILKEESSSSGVRRIKAVLK